MDTDSITNEKKYCPKCKTPLMEKIPNDKRQLKKVIRFFCVCGYYKDIPLDDVENLNKGLMG
jgi:RNase P subunit RPR2